MRVVPDLIYLQSATFCAGIAAVTDLRSRRIPNWLTGSGFLLGLLLHFTLGGLRQTALALVSGVIAGGIFLLFCLAGGMGAGDMKLMAAVGCLAGVQSLSGILLATALLGALAAVLTTLFSGRLRETVANTCALLMHHGEHGLSAHPELNVRNASMLRLPYAIPIAGGCLAMLLVALREGAGL